MDVREKACIALLSGLRFLDSYLHRIVSLEDLSDVPDPLAMMQVIGLNVPHLVGRKWPILFVRYLKTSKLDKKIASLTLNSSAKQSALTADLTAINLKTSKVWLGCDKITLNELVGTIGKVIHFMHKHRKQIPGLDWVGILNRARLSNIKIASTVYLFQSSLAAPDRGLPDWLADLDNMDRWEDLGNRRIYQATGALPMNSIPGLLALGCRELTSETRLVRAVLEHASHGRQSYGSSVDDALTAGYMISPYKLNALGRLPSKALGRLMTAREYAREVIESGLSESHVSAAKEIALAGECLIEQGVMEQLWFRADWDAAALEVETQTWQLTARGRRVNLPEMYCPTVCAGLIHLKDLLRLFETDRYFVAGRSYADASIDLVMACQPLTLLQMEDAVAANRVLAWSYVYIKDAKTGRTRPSKQCIDHLLALAAAVPDDTIVWWDRAASARNEGWRATSIIPYTLFPPVRSYFAARSATDRTWLYVEAAASYWLTRERTHRLGFVEAFASARTELRGRDLDQGTVEYSVILRRLVDVVWHGKGRAGASTVCFSPVLAFKRSVCYHPYDIAIVAKARVSVYPNSHINVALYHHGMCRKFKMSGQTTVAAIEPNLLGHFESHHTDEVWGFGNDPFVSETRAGAKDSPTTDWAHGPDVRLTGEEYLICSDCVNRPCEGASFSDDPCIAFRAPPGPAIIVSVGTTPGDSKRTVLVDDIQQSSNPQSRYVQSVHHAGLTSGPTVVRAVGAEGYDTNYGIIRSFSGMDQATILTDRPDGNGLKRLDSSRTFSSYNSYASSQEQGPVPHNKTLTQPAALSCEIKRVQEIVCSEQADRLVPRSTRHQDVECSGPDLDSGMCPYAVPPVGVSCQPQMTTGSLGHSPSGLASVGSAGSTLRSESIYRQSGLLSMSPAAKLLWVRWLSKTAEYVKSHLAGTRVSMKAGSSGLRRLFKTTTDCTQSVTVLDLTDRGEDRIIMQHVERYELLRRLVWPRHQKAPLSAIVIWLLGVGRWRPRRRRHKLGPTDRG